MRQPPNYETERTAGHTARRLLRSEGYDVALVTGPSPYDLIAWKDRAGFLFVMIRSSRSKATLSRYREELDLLTGLVRDGKIPGDLEFWIRSQAEWLRYRIMIGGAVQVGGGRSWS